MRLQYFVPKQYVPLFNFLFKAEFVLVIVNYFVIGMMFKVFNGVRFHSNLRLLLQSLLLQYFPALAARNIILLYQMQILTHSDPVESDSVIVVCSLMRIYLFGLVLNGILGLYLERQLATYYIVDYERQRRVHIAIILIFGNTLISGTASYLFTFEIVDWYLLALFGMILTTLGGIGFVRLYKKNRERRAAINKDHRTAKHNYTLSLRFQLDENIRSMKLLKTAFMLLGVQNLLYALLYAAANTEIVREIGNGWVSELLETLFNFFISTDGVIMAFGALLTEETFVHAGKNLKYVGWMFNCCIKENKTKTRDETSVYFVTLQSQWDQYFEGGKEQKTRKTEKKEKKTKRTAVRPVNTA